MATASDGYEWRYRRWQASAPRGEVVVLHGIQSHGGWYSQSCEWLCERGWNVSMLDRRGCGMNLPNRGDCPSFRQLLDDVADYVRTLNCPVVLVGISWGGKLAVALQRRHPGLIDGLVLIAPGLKPRVAAPFSTRLRALVGRFFAPTRLLPIPLNEPELFTAYDERRDFIAKDPLALRHATARLLFESARMDIYLRFSARHVTVPTLLLLAEHDRIIDNARTREFVARFRGSTRVIEYMDAHHTLEFEPAGPPFLDHLNEWLARLPAADSHNTHKDTRPQGETP